LTPVVIDASAGVELIADTTRGRALRSLLPVDAVPWTPETFYVEVGSVLRRWDLNAILTPDQIARALGQLASWPLRVAQVRSLFAEAWRAPPQPHFCRCDLCRPRTSTSALTC
jgi:predicted nucleic acid-binding protein